MMRRSISYTLSVLGAAMLSIGCEPMERNDIGIDCAAESEIDFFQPPQEAIDNPPTFGLAWEAENAFKPNPTTGAIAPVADGGFFCFADPTLNGYPTNAPWPSTGGCPPPTMKAIEGGPFCQEGTNAGTRHQAALHLQAGNHVFWGGQWGNWNMRRDGAAATFPGVDPTTGETVELPADGIAFWAKKEVNSDAQILVQLEDEKVNAAGIDEETGNHFCTAVADSGVQVTVTQAATDPNVQVNGSSSALVDDPSACGNRWNAVLELTDEWALHLLPFDSFYQALQPSRESEPFNPKKIHQVAFAFGTGQTISIWLDEMFLYRNKP